MQNALVWFRKDLRISDNECLLKAADNSFSVVPVYFNYSGPNEPDKIKPGKRSSFREHFLHESLSELHDTIRRSGGKGLLVKDGQPEDEILKLCRKYSIRKVFFASEPGPFEQEQEKAVINALALESVPFEIVHHNSLFEPNSLPFTIGNLPDIFTEFRKRVEGFLPYEVEKESKSTLYFAEYEEPDYQHFLPEGIRSCFSGGETQAWKRLDYYLFSSHLISTYKETRNGLLGEDYSSRFSPWLSLGCVNPRRILFEIKRYERAFSANDSTYWLVFELLWREYFRWIMFKYQSKLFRSSGIKSKAPEIKYNPDVLEEWKNGKTGQPFIDAAMRELNRTGFMSNRARQNAASYLVHDLKQSWLEGAGYFEQMLVDYDVSSNYGNWAYIAGVGNDPRPNRYFNVSRQAEIYDPKNAYVNYWLK